MSKSKKYTKIYEIWTFLFNTQKMCEIEPGRCHGRFLKKKLAERALAKMVETRGGVNNSLFTDGKKTWHFRIVEHDIYNDLSEIAPFSYTDIAAYDPVKMIWKCKMNYSKEEIIIAEPTSENIHNAIRGEENDTKPNMLNTTASPNMFDTTISDNLPF